MPTNQFITIRAPHSNREVDLEVPAAEPIQAYLPDLIKVINWPEVLGGGDVHYHFTDESGKQLDSTQSLAQLGVGNFEMLWLTMGAGTGAPQPMPAAESLPQEEADRRAVPPPPAWAGIPIEAPSLVSMRGLVFVLGEPPVTIGRASREAKPAVDLTELDAQLLSSRRHAEILKEGGNYVLRAFATTNGTFINGAELPAGEKKPLKDGDELQFGFRGVALVFRLP